MKTSILSGHSVSDTVNLFKNGRMPTIEEYTDFWVRLINQIEQEKGNQSVLR